MDERLKVARREALRSFWHKLGIVVVALLAYGGLVLLGSAKHKYEKDEKNKWQLNRKTLDALAKTAQTIAAPVSGAQKIASPANASTPPAKATVSGPQTTTPPATTSVPGTQKTAPTVTSLTSDAKADVTLLSKIANQLVDGEKAKGTDSKPDFVAAAEQLADERIWRETADKIRELATDNKPDEHYLDRIAGQESLARTRIADLHALIEASATQIEKSQEKPAPLRAIFDEKHPLYVLYEICWYMLLALAVLASSWLLLTIFTVLPFTEAEGYWTKRIGEIIEKFAPGMASAALPLASAGLVAATVFAGTSFATTPGGYARPTTTVRMFDDRSMHLSVQPIGPTMPPPDIQAALEDVKSAINAQIGTSREQMVNALGERAGKLEEHLQQADERQKNTLACATSADAHAGNAEQNADQAKQAATKAEANTKNVDKISSTTQSIAGVIGKPKEAEQSLFGNVGAIDDKFTASGKTIGDAKKDVDNQYAATADARSASFAQRAMVDTRAPFWRIFGRTVFRVGPGAVYSMAAYLNVKLDSEGKPLANDTSTNAKFINALIAGEKATREGMNSGEFRKTLRDGQPADVVGLMKTYDRQLLHLCALDRN